jgi:hypothetical protein
MTDRRFAGLAVKSEISIGNLFTFVTMLTIGVLAYSNMQNNINNNTEAIKAGILPEARLRVLALETRYGIEIRGLREELAEIKKELRHLRGFLNRTSLPNLPDEG